MTGTIRLARDEDAQDLFGLLALCFAEYPGCFVDPHDDLQDLLRPGLSFAERGGAFWVGEDERGRVSACIAVDEPSPGMAELHRLYVRPDHRRAGLARRLVQLAEDHAQARGYRRIVAWSDNRFTAAHGLYRRLGYQATGRSRALGDISRSVEDGFEKDLDQRASGDSSNRASRSAGSR